MLKALLTRIVLRSALYQACSDSSFRKDRNIHYLETDIQGRETERKHLLEAASEQQAKLNFAYSQADQLQLELNAKKNQVAELQRAVSNLQGARDSVQRHNDQLRLMLDNAYKSIEMLTGEAAEAEANDKRFKEEAQRYRDSVKQKIRGAMAGIDRGDQA